MGTAILLATAAAESPGPAALLRFRGSTPLAHLADQLYERGIDDVTVLTRPEWKHACEEALGGRPVTVLGISALSDAFRRVADLLETGQGAAVLAQAEVVLHGSLLDGLLADPRVTSGILTSTRLRGSPRHARVRIDRGRIVSAESPFHTVTRPTAAFLGLLKLDEADRGEAAGVARRLAGLCEDGLPAGWEEELAAKVEIWGRRFFRQANADSALAAQLERWPEGPKWLPDPDVIREDVDARFRSTVLHPAAAAGDDAVTLLVTGLVRSGVVLTATYRRALWWARPLSQERFDEADVRMAEIDEDQVLLSSAVKAQDGFFTTFFVSPYSRYLARWTARRRMTPNQVTTISMLLGVLAAAAFAYGTRVGLVVGAVLLQVAFTTDCVDGQLARYTRQFSKLGAWLDSVFDRGKEYLVYAGLAWGATRMGAGFEVWVLASAALLLQTVRHYVDFGYAAAQHRAIAAAPRVPLHIPADTPAAARAAAKATARPQHRPGAPAKTAGEADENGSGPTSALQALGRLGVAASRRFEEQAWTMWVKRILVLPIGERFALISVTAAIWNPTVTFVALLAWGLVAFSYTVTGRVLRSLT